MTSTLRVLLAATALLVTYVEPAEPSRHAALVYTALTIYLGYAVVLYAASRRRQGPPSESWQFLPLVDVFAYATLIALTGASNSIYFTLLFFAILTASLHGGFRFGLAVKACSVLLFVTISAASRPTSPEFDLNRFLLRLSSLSLLGYLTAYVGGYEARLRRRLALLRDISVTSNPRFGPDRMLGRMLERLRAFFDADVCVAILPAEADGAHVLRTLTRDGPGRSSEAGRLSPAIEHVLLAFAPDEVAFFRRPHRTDRLVPETGRPNRGQRDEVAELLGVAAYLSVPLRSGTHRPGRLYIGAVAPRFDRDDADFLLQAADQMMPALRHVELVERMATRAADDERRRIALDIHDRIIQPHIGLQIGIAAVEQLAANLSESGLPALRDRLRTLNGLADHALDDLRGYVQELHDGGAAGRDGRLVESLRRFGSRFEEATGIQVSVDAPGEISVDPRLAAELFSMTTEAVSNVRRHTSSTSVDVQIRLAGERVVLRVENPEDLASPCEPFLPHSISQRAAAAGGVVSIERNGPRGTAVIVDLPL